MDMDLVLFGLCMWASVATGVAVWFGSKFAKAEFALMVLTMGMRHIAEGKAKLSVNADGELKLTKLGE